MKILFTILLAPFLFLSTAVRAQTSTQILVNKIWETQTGSPDTLDWSASDLDYQRHLIVVGNTITATQGTNLLVTKYDSSGSIIWQHTFNNSSNGNDYGVALTTDGSGNIYIACASYRGSTNDYDYNILKYNSSGTLQWNTYYNGTGSSFDIPTAIIHDASNNIYVTGTSVRTSNLNDYLTMKLNSSGTIQWTNSYDFAHLSDIPAAIDIINNKLLVSGGSDSTLVDMDFAILKYHMTTGAQLSVKRSSAPGAGFDIVSAMAKDFYGNFYVTGRAYRGATGYDMKTIKFDTSFSLLWTKYYDLDSGADAALDIELDAYNNVYLTGYGTRSGKQEMVTIKYNSSGTEQWHRSYIPVAPFTNAQARKLSVSPFNAVYVTGFQNDAIQSDVVILSYDLNGNIRWSRKWIGTGNGNDLPSFVKFDMVQQHLYLTVRTWTGTQYAYVAITFEEWSKTSVVDSVGDLKFVKDQLIINFNPAVVDTDFVNDKDKRYDRMLSVIDYSVVAAMGGKTGINFISDQRVQIIKCHRWLTTTDTMSITRLGDTIKIPPFWSEFLVTLPPGYNLQAIADSLQKLNTGIFYAQLNHVGQLTGLSNDPLLTNGNSAGLVPDGTIPNADINIDPAWEISVGNNNVKIGVYDCGINWAHEDFGDGTFAGSKIVGGYDYVLDIPFDGNDPIPDAIGHGTACAGLIGALRDNGLGGAGVAGGSVDGTDGMPPFNTGVQLFAMKIANIAIVSDDIIGDAIEQGATNTPLGFGLHIMSNSWQQFYANSYVHRAIEFANRNQVVFVAASANTLDNSLVYPSSYNEDWVIKVGANDETGDRAFFSTYGNNLDLIAPGIHQLYDVLDNDDPNTYTDMVNSFFTDGTSYACPITSGVAGLLLGYINDNPNAPNNLGPSDVEHLMENYCTDLKAAGYDDSTGWGRLNAGNTMQHVHLPEYEVKHFSGSVAASTATEDDPNVLIELTNGFGNLQPNHYWATRYKITITVSHNIGNSTILDYWVRNSSTNLFSAATTQNCEYYQVTDSWDNTQATITGYFYFIKTDLGGNTYNKYIPIGPNSTAVTAYTLHLYDPTVGIENIPVNDFAEAIPNPATNDCSVYYTLDKNSRVKISLFDLNGREIVTLPEEEKSQGTNHHTFQLNNLADGIYICKIETADKVSQLKIVKQ